jgi:hypothetical protein
VDREISPVTMWAVVGLVLVAVLVGGYLYTGRNRGKLTPEQERQWKQTFQQQYQTYFHPPQGGGH